MYKNYIPIIIAKIEQTVKGGG